MLLNHNADVNLADNFGTTPLHIALFKENIPIVNLLLAYGADVRHFFRASCKRRCSSWLGNKL